MTEPTKTDIEIAKKLNDNLRRNPYNESLGEFRISPMVSALPDHIRFELITLMQAFENFYKDCGGKEHDYGRINFRNDRYFFIIDYIDSTTKKISTNPYDLKSTKRVLTLIHADEY